MHRVNPLHTLILMTNNPHLSLRAKRSNPKESEKAKIKMQNDRAKFKNVVRP